MILLGSTIRDTGFNKIVPGKAKIIKLILKYKTPYLFLLPAILLIYSIKYYAFFTAIIMSFYDWNGINSSVFVGLKNYLEVFQDVKLMKAFVNIFIISTTTLLINLTIPLFAAEIVFNIKNNKFKNFLKLGFILPMVVPGMVIMLMWRFIYSGDTGILNQFLTTMGLDYFKQNWLGNTSTALGALIFVGFPWVAGLPFLLYLAGLMGIPKDLFEVAEIEGIKGMKRFWYIDLPMISSQMKLVVMYVLIQSFQTFELPYALTGGGPGYYTTVPALQLYEQAFVYNRFGYASCIGVMLFIIILFITIINQKILKNTETID